MFEELTPSEWERTVSRVLIVGGPNTFKTTSIVETFDRPLHLLSYPGEKGSGVIPTNNPEIKGYVWKEDDPSKDTVDHRIREIEKVTIEILAGKRGPVKTFCGDGLHKMASLYWNREYQKLRISHERQLTDGKVTDDELRLRAYGNENFGSCREVLNYISLVCHSSVPTVVFTCWEGPEPDERDGTGGANKTHVFADLPGKLARRSTGEFGVTLYAEVSLPGPDGKQKGTWQLKKAGKVWGVGVKVPREIAEKLPAKSVQDWSKLFPVLLGKADPSTVKVGP